MSNEQIAEVIKNLQAFGSKPSRNAAVDLINQLTAQVAACRSEQEITHDKVLEQVETEVVRYLHQVERVYMQSGIMDAIKKAIAELKDDHNE